MHAPWGGRVARQSGDACLAVRALRAAQRIGRLYDYALRSARPCNRQLSLITKNTAEDA